MQLPEMMLCCFYKDFTLVVPISYLAMMQVSIRRAGGRAGKPYIQNFIIMENTVLTDF